MNTQQSIKATLIGLATIAGKELNEFALEAFMDALSDLDGEAVLESLKNWTRTNKGFPYPADIREKVMPEIKPEDDAQDVANLVIAAVGRFGYTNPDRAQEHVGELGWETITRMGGWKHLCETLNHQNENTYRAQIRDYASAVRRRAMRGELEQKPALPSPQNESVQKLISQTFTKDKATHD